MNISLSKICEICKAPALYCCPRCSVRTCSLACVNAHKASTGCNGVRDKTAYVPMEKFSNTELLSDYRFLEETGRIIDEAQRSERTFEFSKHLPRHLFKLRNAASQRNTRLRIMPPLFTKRKSNTTYYRYKDKVILWKIEWVFPDAEISYSDDRVHESLTINECLDKYLLPECSETDTAHKLAFYQAAGHKGVSVLMKKEGDPSNAQRYYQLDKNKSLKSNFSGKVIVEYPELLVVLQNNLPAYHLVGEYPVKVEQEQEVLDITAT